MTVKKISQLSQVPNTSILGTEAIPIQQNNVLKQTTIAAVAARLSDIVKYANSSGIQDISELSKSEAIDRATASAVLQQSSSAFSGALHRSPNAITSIFIYDTSNDSDGGAWTDKCQHTSWYNEPLSGRWLGAQTSEIVARHIDSSLGTELITNGNFDSNITNWTGLTWITGGYANLVSTTAWTTAGQSVSVVGGKRYKATFKLISTTAPIRFYLRSMPSGVLFNDTTYYGSSGEYSAIASIPLTDTSVDIIMGSISTASYTATFDSVSFKEVLSTTTKSGDYYQSTADGAFYALSKNLLTLTATLPTQTQWLTAGTYTLSSTFAGTAGTVVLSGQVSGITHTAGTATTFTVATSGNVTFTVSGSVLNAQCEFGSVATVYKANTSTNRYYQVYRGNKREFPKKVAIVAEASSVTLYDLTEYGNPMWMRFAGTTAYHALSWNISAGATNVSSVYALNGKFVTGDTGYNGLLDISFPLDRIKLGYWGAQGSWGLVSDKISDRHNTGGKVSGNSYLLTGRPITSVCLAVMPNTPINTFGIQNPMIAVAGYNLDLINYNESVITSTENSAVTRKVILTKNMVSVTDSNTKTWRFALNPSILTSGFSLTNISGNDFNRENTISITQKSRSDLFRISSSSLQRLNFNESAISKGAAATITPTYNTGYQIGDIRRTYLCDTDAGTIGTSVSPSVLFAASEQGVWYDPSDLSTMFTDSAGTTPVAAPGSGGATEPVVGLMLDKSKGLVLGPELVTNGDFSAGTTGWSISAIGGSGLVSVDSGRAKVELPTGGQVSPWIYQAVTLTVGKIYKLSYSYEQGTSTSTRCVISATSSGGSAIYLKPDTTGNGTFSVIFTAATATTYFCFQALTSTAGAYAYFDNISVRELPGNHATQSTSANRPTLSARVNQLIGTASLATQTVTVKATQQTLTFTGTGFITLSGAATGTYTAGSYTFTPSAGSLTLAVSGMVTNADLRESNAGVGLPAYQRVTDVNDYDTTGFPYYLKFNGSNSSLSTGSINFTSTDKMTVFAGVRKVGSTGIGCLTELSSSIDTNNGSFLITAPINTNQYGFHTKGTLLVDRQVTSGYPSPVTNVISSEFNIVASNVVTEVVPRINGSTPSLANSGSNTGTGTYGNYPLYIGARAGTSLFFNGNIYSLIIRGAATDTATIANIESYVGNKTINSAYHTDKSYNGSTSYMYGTLTKSNI
jgi:hypothetical protein